MADHQEASLTLPSRPASVPEARRFAGTVLAEWGLPATAELTDSVRLIVSELVTNAVLHTLGRSPVLTVLLRLERETVLRVGVRDSHPGLPRRPAAEGECPDGGRGMDIVQCLTAHHGGELSVLPDAAGGKTVWTVLPVVRSAEPLPQ
ncbi:ATP-binding protein [Streptomyces physcomitrii]|uniref:ATP-binding protein n=1 Tax=Streptomyces physcomitrii TaxID=2724184 RepID=A0ABX1H0K7_9ACTN|nr:ATP-binding protein [Streptomyces physcomitrii]NKI41891.1 ATP-binding protein [Streptomyces physcomitrii]